ncbi:response regulator [Sphingosinithalassobacter portus]|uniref:response regulator n=1 Tax=Stakelama portus TaxID=2676234 RepID=UPI000D6E80B1|nr:response regulator [Sphingosinithalassobacter portus]
MVSISSVLIVEDEPLIAMMLEDFLEVLDRQVAGTADSCETALSRLEDGGVDAVILDVNLRAGETSWPVADKLAESGIPFVLATGGSDDSIADAHKGRPVLQKPFTLEAVEAALESLD